MAVFIARPPARRISTVYVPPEEGVGQKILKFFNRKKENPTSEVIQNAPNPTPSPKSPDASSIPKSVPVTSNDALPYAVAMPTRQSILNTGNLGNKEVKSTAAASTPQETIDVRDLDWTYSKNKISNKEEIPYVEIKEFKMAGNSYLSSLMTSALLFPDVAKSSFGKDSVVGTLTNKIQESFKDNKFADFMNNIGNKVKDVSKQLVDKTKPFVNEALTQIKGIDKTSEAWPKSGKYGSDLADKYSYLYIRKPTGRSYIFPYFQDKYVSISNDFADTYQNETKLQGMLKSLSKTMEDVANSVNIASITEPGMFIQRPKFYQFKDEGFELSVSFYLYNTLTPNSYLKNVDLITKLLIQNTPHRHNRILVDPPCIYELTVPGTGFFPYTYISKMDVEHVGTRRTIESQISTITKKVIVPDAFKINLSFKSLIMDSNNLFIPEMGDGGINVSQKYGANEFLKNNKESNKTTIQTTAKPVVTSPMTGSGGPVSIIDKNSGVKTTVMSQTNFLPNVRSS